RRLGGFFFQPAAVVRVSVGLRGGDAGIGVSVAAFRLAGFAAGLRLKAVFVSGAARVLNVCRQCFLPVKEGRTRSLLATGSPRRAVQVPVPKPLGPPAPAAPAPPVAGVALRSAGLLVCSESWLAAAFRAARPASTSSPSRPVSSSRLGSFGWTSVMAFLPVD